MSLPPSHAGDSVPEDVLDAAKAAFGQRSGDDVAVLVHDSLVDGDDPAEGHFLRFEHPRTSCDVQVASEPTGARLSGAVSPPDRGVFELVLEGSGLGLRHKSSDGSFAFGPVGHGLVRITFTPDGAKRVSTDWFRI